MQQEINSASIFFKEEVPNILDKLQVNQKAAWGIMTPQHMVEHLIVTYKMSIGRIKIPLAVKPEDAERNKVYLIKDGPMRRNVAAPTGNNDLQALRFEHLDQAVAKLKEEIVKFDDFCKENPSFEAIHPYGGSMNTEEWILFHRKHVKHHLIQFGLIPDYA